MISPHDTFDSLVQSTTEFGKKRADGLIIMPFFRAYDYLFRHLELLGHQTFQDFNLLIVLNPLSDEDKVLDFIRQRKFGYGIIVARRKEDTGSAGGFFTGEKYALENGYGFIVIADDDCLPASERHIETLVEEYRRGNPLVYARAVFVLDNEEVHEGRGLAYYSLIGTSLMRKAGLHFAPLYMGAEDGEYQARLLTLARPVMTDSKVVHPKEHSIFVDFTRSIGYRVNEMALCIPRHYDIYLYDIAVVSLCYMIFGTPPVRDGGLHMLSCAITHRYGPEASKGFKGEPPISPGKPEFDLIVTPLSSLQGKGYFLYKYGSGHMIKQLSELAIATFRKRALLMPIHTFGALVSTVTAKEAWVSSRTGYYLLAKNHNPAAHALKVFLLVLLFPPFLTIAVLTLILNIARKPKTTGYGV